MGSWGEVLSRGIGFLYWFLCAGEQCERVIRVKASCSREFEGGRE